MTAHKHLKDRIRARMAKTGERYTTARRHVVGAAGPQTTAGDLAYFPGIDGATAAVRSILTSRGVRAPHTGEPFTEAMLMGIGGGIGAGVFAFRYEQADVSTLYLAGRHSWMDNAAYLEPLCERVGATIESRETGAKATAERQLAELLEQHAPVIAWADLGTLTYRGMPERWEGGGYHVVTVFELGENHALIGDVGPRPIELPRSTLTATRARIRKQRNRLLAVTDVQRALAGIDLEQAVRAGIEACVRGLTAGERPGFDLRSVATLAKRINGRGKDGWERAFPITSGLWAGLTMLYQFVEHYGTGGGLCRPLFSEFLAEAASAVGAGRGADELAALADHYRQLGERWSALALSALPEEVAPMRQVRELHDAIGAAYTERGADAEAELRSAWQQLVELDEQAADQFPLSADAAANLRAVLAAQLEQIVADEQSGVRFMEDYLRAAPAGP